MRKWYKVFARWRASLMYRLPQVFYDDEYRNSEVTKLGVMFVLVDRGLDHKVFDKGLEKWRRAREAAAE